MNTSKHPKECAHHTGNSSPCGTTEGNNSAPKINFQMITYPFPDWDFCKLQVLPFRTGVAALTRSLHASWTSFLSHGFSGLKYHQHMPGWSIYSFDVDVKRAIMNKGHFFPFYQRPDKLLFSICFPVRSAAWTQPSDASHLQLLRAHRLLSAQHTAKAISRFLTRSMDRQRAVVNEQALKSGVSESEW